MRRVHFTAVALVTSVLMFGIGFSVSADAKVTGLEITSKQSYGTFKPGEFEFWEGRIAGELQPIEKIPDIDKAPKNANGLVEYSAKITLIFPKDPKSGNGVLLVDIPNRGRPYAQALYNSPRDEPFEAGTFEVGTGFLQDQGFAVAEVQWELGQGANLPIFLDSSGQKRFVEGVGFAIVRDTADFLAHATSDTSGTANPLQRAVKRTLAAGKSQSGRYLKTFLLNGFNMIEGRRVFDGMHVFVSGAGMLPIMQSGTGPQSSATGVPTFEDPEFRGVNEDVLTIGDLIQRVKVGVAKVHLNADAEALVWLRRGLDANRNYAFAPHINEALRLSPRDTIAYRWTWRATRGSWASMRWALPTPFANTAKLPTPSWRSTGVASSRPRGTVCCLSFPRWSMRSSMRWPCKR